MIRMDDGPEYDTQRAMAAFVRARCDEDEQQARDHWTDETPGTWLHWVLSVVTAHRAVVDLADVWRGDANDYGVADRAVQIVAAAYADHPDYAEAWRP